MKRRIQGVRDSRIRVKLRELRERIESFIPDHWERVVSVKER